MKNNRLVFGEVPLAAKLKKDVGDLSRSAISSKQNLDLIRRLTGPTVLSGIRKVFFYFGRYENNDTGLGSRRA